MNFRPPAPSNLYISEQKLQTPLVSVIIPSYNSRNYIRDCLDSLVRQTSNYPFEIIIADSSDNGTTQLVESEYPQVKLIKLTKQTPPGPARNAAIEKAQGQIIACIDSDCVAEQGWIDNIVAAHQKEGKVIGGAIINGTPRSFIGTAEYYVEFSEYHPAQKQSNCRMIPTCNLSFARSIFKKIGGFETAGGVLTKAEDLLFCYRINQCGIPILFEPTICVYHKNRVRLNQVISNQHSLGFHSAVVRRIVKVKGSFLVKHPFFFLLIPLIKILILVRRIITWGFIPFVSFLMHLPLVLIGICYYTAGFAQGRKVSLNRIPKR